MILNRFLGVRIDPLNKEEALKKALVFLHSSNGQYRIFTPNPEMLVKAQEDAYFKDVLNGGDLNLCDGFGLRLASGFKLPRVTGVDFMLDLCRLAAEQNKSIYLLGAESDEIVRKTAEVLQKLFLSLKVVGMNKGPEIEESKFKIGKMQALDIKSGENEVLINNINQSKPEILFVAFGMGKQEKWIAENIDKLPSVKIAMGVGGSFDFISGKVARAPLLMRKIGLEWLYRLVRQPSRGKRIWNATVMFFYFVIRNGRRNA